MTREEADLLRNEADKERLRRYRRAFSTDDAKWVLADLKARTTLNTVMGNRFARDNNPLGLAHLTGQRDLVAGICQLVEGHGYIPDKQGDLHE